MTFPIARKGYWISADGSLDRHDCAVAGHMPDACPGGNAQALLDGSDFMHCYRERHPVLPDECKPVLGSACNDGYFGNGCTKCCKPNQECSHLRGKRNPVTQELYKLQWYFTESDKNQIVCNASECVQERLTSWGRLLLSLLALRPHTFSHNLRKKE